MNITIKTILGVGIIVNAIATSIQSSLAEQKFACNESRLSTSIKSSRGELPMIHWNARSFVSTQTPLTRCREVTARFNRFYNNGTLKYMSTGTINNYPVICVAESKGGNCLPEGLLITLKQDSNPNTALNIMLDRRILPIHEPIQLSSDKNVDSEDEVVLEIDGKLYVDVEIWLDELNGLSLK